MSTRGYGPPLFAGIATLAASIAMAVIYGVPRPRTHDEFSYVLAGDTFASGRLTNPTHPLWRSFETFHVLSRPSYASKYHPAQGMFLALGELIGHRPWIGVWLSSALASAAVAWMIFAVMPNRWAYVGAGLASLTIGATYWSYSYWGGSVAALGGALLVGAVLRAREPSAPLDPPPKRLAILAGIGTNLLLLSRPLEGGLLWISLAVATTIHLRALHPDVRRTLFVRLFPAYALVVSAGLFFLLYYQHRVTGNAFLPPYVLYERTYFATPPFVWGALRPEPLPLTKEFAAFAAYNLARYKEVTDPSTAFSDAFWRLVSFVGFFVPAPLLVALPFAAREPSQRRVFHLAIAAIGVVLVVMIGSLWSYPHYLAPLTALFVLVVVRGLAGLAAIRIGDRAVGRVAVAVLLMLTFLNALGEAKKRGEWMHGAWHQSRAALEQRLEATGERHVVIVRYAEPHDFLEEWVYNRASIDDAPVVFAREIDDASTRSVLDYFPARKAWLLTVSKGHEDLVPLTR
jgi:hypothetical protein